MPDAERGPAPTCAHGEACGSWHSALNACLPLWLARGYSLPTGGAIVSTPLHLRLSVSALPDRDLLTNARDGRLSRWERADAVNLMKAQWMPFFLKAFPENEFRSPLAGPVVLHWTLYVPNYRTPDWDGWVAALKPLQDLLVSIGVLQGDGPRWVRGGSVTVVVDKTEAPLTELRLEVFA